MATSQSYEAKHIIAVYDSEGINTKTLDELASTDHQMTWNQSRFPDLESRSNSGLRVNSYVSELSTQDTLVSGLLLDEDDGKWQGAKRSGGDAKFYPLFHEGQFQFKNNWYTLASERTIQEVANLTSQVNTDETAFRHRFSKLPDSQFGARSTIYKRQQDMVPTPYIDFQLVSEFTPYAGHLSTVYHKGSFIDWDVVDDTVPESMIDEIEAGSFELVFNQDLTQMPAAKPSYTPVSLNDRLPYLSTCFSSSETNVYLTEYFPVRNSTFNFYTYDGTNVVQWTGTDSLDASGPSDLHYILNPSSGEVITNPNLTNFPGDPLAEFNTLPLVEYRIQSDEGHYYSAQESSLARLVTNVDRGSVIYALRDPEIFESLAIDIEIPTLITTDNTNWTNSFYGDGVHKVVFTVTNSVTNEKVSGVPLKINIDSGIGQLLGIENDVVLYTDENGEAYTYFLPPMLGDSIGTKNVTRGVATNELVLTQGTEHYFENIPGEIYLYGIYKDDPLVGRLDDPSNFEGTIVWDSNLKNGVKRILYEYDVGAIHPLLGTSGAFVALRPIQVTSNKFIFLNALPEDNATDNANNLGGYFIAGPRKTNLSVQIDLDTIGVSTISTSTKRNFYIVTQLSSTAKGEYVSLSASYPFGWRLPGSIDPTSQLGGALYLTVNSVAGTANILFETNQQYKHFTAGLGLQVYVSDT